MFLSHAIVLKGRNRARLMYFMKLAILIFGSPGDMQITNLTRMPLEYTPVPEESLKTSTLIHEFTFLYIF